jgi:hypothetical protein
VTNRRRDRRLDDWLRTATASLNAALDDVLDLDAGLADAQPPDVRNLLVHRLNTVLDLNAGLEHIVHAAPSSPTTPEHPTAKTSLQAFATEIAQRHPHQRLLARTSLPRQALAALRTITQLALHARDHAIELDPDLNRTTDHIATQRSEGAFGLRDDRTRARALNRYVARAYEGALERQHALNSAFRTARARARDLARALNRDSADGHALTDALTSANARAHALNLAHNLARELTMALNRVQAFDLDRALARDSAVAHAVAHAVARHLAHAYDCGRADVLARADLLDNADARRLGAALSTAQLDRDVVTALDQLENALSNVAGADLTEADLTGIPLEGVRWSHETRWPARWAAQIRRDSAAIGPGLYEIRSDTGTTNPTHTSDAPV